MKIGKPVKRTRPKQPRLWVWVILVRDRLESGTTPWRSAYSSGFQPLNVDSYWSMHGRRNVRIVRVDVPVPGRRA